MAWNYWDRLCQSSKGEGSAVAVVAAERQNSSRGVGSCSLLEELGSCSLNPHAQSAGTSAPTRVSSPGAAPSSRLLATTRPMGELTHVFPIDA